MTPLDPGQLSVLRVRAALLSFGLLIPIVIADATWLRGSPLPFGFVTGAGAVLLLLTALLLPERRYRSWSYEMNE